MHPLPPLLHNRPERIAAAVEQTVQDLRPHFDRVAVAYADCGTYGALDEVCARLGVPRLPGTVVDRLVEHFGGLQRLLGATVEDLQAVEGVGDARARGVREGLSRLAEASILERYV